MPYTLTLTVISLQSTPTHCFKLLKYRFYQEGHTSFIPRPHRRRKWPENEAIAMNCE